MKNIGIIVLLVMIIITGCAAVNQSNRGESKLLDNIEIVPTMQDEIKADSCWTPTFQLIWNDLKNDVVKQDIVLNPQVKIAENLNKEMFDTEMINEDYYFKTYGPATIDLKKKIEKAIWEKFNQKSDILDDFIWSSEASNNSRLFFYSMLYKKMEFLNKFDKLENGSFKDCDNVEYFGIEGRTNKNIREQVEVLFYNSPADFAVILNTKSNDQVILYKNPAGKTFEEIYKNLSDKAKSFKGETKLSGTDELKVPVLNIDKKREYEEIQNKPFKTANPDLPLLIIEKAVQTIQFSLDETGAKVKSEAGMGIKSVSALEQRYFYVDDTFAVFLKEKDKNVPYFAAKIDDITRFQDIKE